MGEVCLAMRGQMGDNEYYVTTIKAYKLIQSVGYASEMENWPDMTFDERMQRELKGERIAQEIVPYLSTDPDWFFGALIVDIYSGWEYAKFQTLTEVADVKYDVYSDAMRQAGFLTLPDDKRLIIMPSTTNKVKFGLKNCHYAKATIDPDTNAVTFGTPVAIPGAVNLSLDPEGDTEPFYADDMVYYTTVANNGYSGDLEIALIPDSFRKDILKETEDTNGVLIEDSTVEPEHFALLFEFSGDKKKIRHCMYYCTAARPTIKGKTNEDSKEVQTESLEITAMSLPSGLVKVKTGANTDDTVYNDWYKSVYQSPAPEERSQGQG